MKPRDAYHINNREFGLECKDPSLAQQQFRDESDPVYIAEKFGLTGELPTVLQLPSYGDYTGVFDYQTAMNTIVAGQRSFMELPAKVRARFSNDPQEFLQFCADESNLEEARRLGLLKPTETFNEKRNIGLPQAHEKEQAGTPGTQRSAEATETDKKP